MSEIKVINFMRSRKIAALLSALAVIGSIASLSFQGLNLGLDFSGGTLLELQYDRPANVEEVRADLVDLELPSAIVVYFGSDSDILIRVRDNLGQERAEAIASTLAGNSGAEIDLQRVEYVGPQVGEELREDGGRAFGRNALCGHTFPVQILHWCCCCTLP